VLVRAEEIEIFDTHFGFVWVQNGFELGLFWLCFFGLNRVKIGFVWQKRCFSKLLILLLRFIKLAKAFGAECSWYVTSYL
jgi:hypothetical protein